MGHVAQNGLAMHTKESIAVVFSSGDSSQQAVLPADIITYSGLISFVRKTFKQSQLVSYSNSYTRQSRLLAEGFLPAVPKCCHAASCYALSSALQELTVSDGHINISSDEQVQQLQPGQRVLVQPQQSQELAVFKVSERLAAVNCCKADQPRRTIVQSVFAGHRYHCMSATCTGCNVHMTLPVHRPPGSACVVSVTGAH